MKFRSHPSPEFKEDSHHPAFKILPALSSTQKDDLPDMFFSLGVIGFICATMFLLMIIFLGGAYENMIHVI